MTWSRLRNGSRGDTSSSEGELAQAGPPQGALRKRQRSGDGLVTSRPTDPATISRAHRRRAGPCRRISEELLEGIIGADGEPQHGDSGWPGQPRGAVRPPMPGLACAHKAPTVPLRPQACRSRRQRESGRGLGRGYRTRLTEGLHLDRHVTSHQPPADNRSGVCPSPPRNRPGRVLSRLGPTNANF